MNYALLWLVKLTGALPQVFYFRRKTLYEDRNKSDRHIRGASIIVSNHTSVMDYTLYMFTFFGRTLRPLTAEVLYKRSRLFSWFLKSLGAIRVDRDMRDYGFMTEATKTLGGGGVVLVFPEGRLPLPNEKSPLEFKPSFIYIALESGAPIIPVYTNGSYGKRKRARMVIGEKIYVSELYDKNKSEKENIAYLTELVKSKVYSLSENIEGEELT